MSFSPGATFDRAFWLSFSIILRSHNFVLQSLLLALLRKHNFGLRNFLRKRESECASLGDLLGARVLLAGSSRECSHIRLLALGSLVGFSDCGHKGCCGRIFKLQS